MKFLRFSLLISASILTITAILYVVLYRQLDFVDIIKIGEYNLVGDALGGIIGPTIGLISVILVYYSFQEQFKANQLIIQARNEDSIKIDVKEYLTRLEDKYQKLYHYGNHTNGETTVTWLFESYSEYFSRLTSANITSTEDLRILDSGNTQNNIVDNFKQNISLFKDLLSILEYCVFFNAYLSRAKSKFIKSAELQETLNLYISEYNHFFENKIDYFFVRKFPSQFYKFEKYLSDDNELFEVLRNKRTVVKDGIRLLKTNTPKK